MIKKTLLFAAIAALFGTVAFASPSLAFDLFPNCSEAGCSVVKDSGVDSKAQGLIYSAIYVLGGVSVIMVIVGAIRMAVAQGDPGNIKSGRLTILWSVIGLFIAMLSFTIVKFVVDWGWVK